MANNIETLNEDIKKKAAEDAAAAQEVFGKSNELSEEDLAWAREQEGKVQTVMTETTLGGGEKTTPVDEYAASLDKKIKSINAMTDAAAEIKAVNQGDVVRTVADIREETKRNAMRAFRELSVKGDDTEDEISDNEILRINDEALAAIQKYMNTPKLDSDAVLKTFLRMPLRQICSILPKEFVDIYVRESEIKANNIKARERLVTSISYLTVTGPELDYLNDYIDNEHRLMALSQQLMKCQTDFLTVLQSPAKMSEIVQKAMEIDPPVDDTAIWAKHISDPRRIHNEFAQRAVIMQEYKVAYEAILRELPPIDPEAIKAKAEEACAKANRPCTEFDIQNAMDKEQEYQDEARALIQEQIDESATKNEVYLSVTKLEKMRDLWHILTMRYRNEKRMNYKTLMRDATDAMDRIRRAKQNVPFPVFDAKLLKRPAELANLFIEKYPEALESYNKVIRPILANPENAANTGVSAIEIEGIDDAIVYRYTSILLLILYGRIMKALGDRSDSKYDAIMLDSYFTMLCRLATDVYVMTDVWNMMKEFVAYAIKAYPAETGKKGGK